MKLKTIIVDDEDLARENLQMMLEEFCPEIEIIGSVGNNQDAKKEIEYKNPDVVFLDIRMPSGSEGFELLDAIKNRNFMVVFVTAFRDYAIRAFNANAVHYVLKPIDIDDLKASVEKLKESKQAFDSLPENYGQYKEILHNLSSDIQNKKHSNKITISHTKGLKIIEDDNIVNLDANGNCTSLYFNDGSRYLDTRTLKVYEELLNPDKFYRIHKSHIINLDQMDEYLSEDGHFAVMKNKKQLPIARNRLSAFLTRLKSM